MNNVNSQKIRAVLEKSPSIPFAKGGSSLNARTYWDVTE
jgi:hypothetical protein